MADMEKDLIPGYVTLEAHTTPQPPACGTGGLLVLPPLPPRPDPTPPRQLLSYVYSTYADMRCIGDVMHAHAKVPADGISSKDAGHAWRIVCLGP